MIGDSAKFSKPFKNWTQSKLPSLDLNKITNKSVEGAWNKLKPTPVNLDKNPALDQSANAAAVSKMSEAPEVGDKLLDSFVEVMNDSPMPMFPWGDEQKAAASKPGGYFMNRDDRTLDLYNISAKVGLLKEAVTLIDIGKILQ